MAIHKPQLTSGTAHMQIGKLPAFKTNPKLKMAPSVRPVSRPQNRYVRTSRRHNDSARIYIQPKAETVVVVMETAVVVMATYNLTVQDTDGLRDVFHTVEPRKVLVFKKMRFRTFTSSLQSRN